MTEEEGMRVNDVPIIDLGGRPGGGGYGGGVL